MALTDNLLYYYSLDNTLNDSLGTYNLTNSGAVYTASGKINGCYSFDGSSYMYNSSAPSVTNSITISAWIYVNNYSSYRCIGGVDRSGTGYSHILSVDTSGKLRLELYNGTNNPNTQSSSTLSTSTWYHVVGTFNGTTLKVFINGSQNGTPTSDSNSYSGTGVYIGTYPGTPGNYFLGKVDEFAIWNRVLSDAEITQLYNSGAGLAYPFTTGWSKKIFGISTASKINGVSISSISKVNGV